jgi:deoxyribose-phosphate aldolase
LKISREEMAKLIDHTDLRPQATSGDIERLCSEAEKNGFYAVCVNPCRVALAKRLTSTHDKHDIYVCAVIGFPLGAGTTETKLREAMEALANGADELDMVMNIGWLKERRYDAVKGDIASVVEAARGEALKAARKKTVKVIIEACYLDDSEKVQACRLAAQAGAHFVKTSTGLGSGGATAHDVALMRKTVGDTMGVKASGGIRSAREAVAMVEAGASRIGTSAGVKIMEGMA